MIVAVVSSVDAAFSSEIADKDSVLSMIASLLVLISFILEAISLISPDTSLILFTTFSKSICISLRTFSSLKTASLIAPAEAVLRSEIAIMFSIISLISLADPLDCSARFLISPATTANPRPASPALAASIDAFKESKFVCSAMDAIIVAASLIF